MAGITGKTWQDGFQGPQIMAADLQKIDEGVKRAIEDATLAVANAIPVGSILPFAGSMNPSGWVICDGRSLQRTQYPLLYQMIGVTYGAPNSSQFNVPDLRGRFIYGKGSGGLSQTLGGRGGAETHTITEEEMPSHWHRFPGESYTMTWAKNTIDVISDATMRVGGQDGTKLGTQQAANYGTSPVGGGRAHNNMPPYIVLNYIIRAI